MIMDLISDWFTTAWELIGLVFLAMSADLLMPRQREVQDIDPPATADVGPRKGRSTRDALRQPHLA